MWFTFFYFDRSIVLLACICTLEIIHSNSCCNSVTTTSTYHLLQHHMVWSSLGHGHNIANTLLFPIVYLLYNGVQVHTLYEVTTIMYNNSRAVNHPTKRRIWHYEQTLT